MSNWIKTTYGSVLIKDDKRLVKCEEYDCKELLEIDEFLYMYGWNGTMCKKHLEEYEKIYNES